jgi:hypothetical protein
LNIKQKIKNNKKLLVVIASLLLVVAPVLGAIVFSYQRNGSVNVISDYELVILSSNVTMTPLNFVDFGDMVNGSAKTIGLWIQYKGSSPSMLSFSRVFNASVISELKILTWQGLGWGNIDQANVHNFTSYNEIIYVGLDLQLVPNGPRGISNFTVTFSSNN